MAATSIDVEHLFTLTVEVGSDEPSQVRGGPHGDRVVASVAGGTFEGERLRGTVVPPGGDWVTRHGGGKAQLDVRLMLVTDDGANILMQYKGIADFKAGTARTAPQFEVGDERYTWLNDVQAVGIGTLKPEGGVTYDVYALR